MSSPQAIATSTLTSLKETFQKYAKKEYILGLIVLILGILLIILGIYAWSQSKKKCPPLHPGLLGATPEKKPSSAGDAIAIIMIIAGVAIGGLGGGVMVGTGAGRLLH